MERGKFTVNIIDSDGKVKKTYEGENPIETSDSDSLGTIGTIAYWFYISFILGSLVVEFIFFCWVIFKIIQL